MEEFLPIQTERLVLRRFGPSDLGDFQAYRSDAELARFQGWAPVPDAQALSFLVSQARQVLGAAGEWLQVAVAERASSTVIGDLGLCMIDEGERRLELGFTLARPWQGHGYASEAVRAALDALFAAERVRSVVATTDTRNVASLALLRRVGFRHLRTQVAAFRGEPCEEQTFEMTEQQWHRRGPA